MDLQKLKEKFQPSDIEWRIGRAGYTRSGKYYGTVLAYITNRAIMNRLDDVCGPENWRNEYREWNVGNRHGVLCGISIKIGNEWITKWDGAENTDIEAIKGGFSDAMKRAGVQWGIGRYLYELEEGFAVVDESGTYFAQGVDKYTGKEYRFRWNPPVLPAWAIPSKVMMRSPLQTKAPLMPKPSASPKSAKISPSNQIAEAAGTARHGG